MTEAGRWRLAGKSGMPTSATPVVLIHGLWLHSSSWEPWITRFEAAGYAPLAPEWPGVAETVEAARRDPESIADRGIQAGDVITSINSMPVNGSSDVEKALDEASKAGRKAVLFQITRDDANRFVALPLAKG